jgi:hypothetical protein
MLYYIIIACIVVVVIYFSLNIKENMVIINPIYINGKETIIEKVKEYIKSIYGKDISIYDVSIASANEFDINSPNLYMIRFNVLISNYRKSSLQISLKVLVDKKYNINVLSTKPGYDYTLTDENDRIGACFKGSGISYNEKECIANKGIWDEIPVRNEECPFYKKNMNYENSRGGIKDNGFCELPVGVVPIGFRKYNDDNAICYNCKNNRIWRGSEGKCCKEQQDKSIYKNLLSSDYKFDKDIKYRKNLFRDIKIK